MAGSCCTETCFVTGGSAERPLVEAGREVQRGRWAGLRGAGWLAAPSAMAATHPGDKA